MSKNSNLWRMKQFYEMYADQPKLAALLRVLPQNATDLFKDSLRGARRKERMSIQSSRSKVKRACKVGAHSGIFVSNNTPQGYARKRTLKPGGYSFCAEGVL